MDWGNALPFVSSEQLQAADVMADCISALENQLAGGWEVSEPARTIHRVGDGQLLLMPAWDADHLAVKVTTILPETHKFDRPRVQGIFVIFELPQMVPVMTVDAAGITALRTPAMSAVATKYLARPDASRLVVFGTGPQATGHIHAMCLVREIGSVGIVGRTAGSAERLAAEVRRSGIDATAVSAGAVADADLVCTCTTSATPVFDGSLLASGAHVNAVGSHQPDLRELDDATFRGATVAVDSVEMALREAGDVIMALHSGALAGPASLVPLGAFVRSEASAADATRTIFKSVGTAGQDLVTGSLLLKLLAGNR